MQEGHKSGPAPVAVAQPNTRTHTTSRRASSRPQALDRGDGPRQREASGPRVEREPPPPGVGMGSAASAGHAGDASRPEQDTFGEIHSEATTGTGPVVIPPQGLASDHNPRSVGNGAGERAVRGATQAHGRLRARMVEHGRVEQVRACAVVSAAAPGRIDREMEDAAAAADAPEPEGIVAPG